MTIIDMTDYVPTRTEKLKKKFAVSKQTKVVAATLTGAVAIQAAAYYGLHRRFEA